MLFLNVSSLHPHRLYILPLSLSSKINCLIISNSFKLQLQRVEPPPQNVIWHQFTKIHEFECEKCIAYSREGGMQLLIKCELKIQLIHKLFGPSDHYCVIFIFPFKLICFLWGEKIHIFGIKHYTSKSLHEFDIYCENWNSHLFLQVKKIWFRMPRYTWVWVYHLLCLSLRNTYCDSYIFLVMNINQISSLKNFKTFLYEVCESFQKI